MSRKLVDPVQFFDHRGRSILSNDHNEQRMCQLEAEVVRLKRLLVAHIKRNQEQPESVATRH